MMKRLAVPDNSFMSFGPHRYRLWYGTVCSQCSASSLYSWNVLAEPSHWGTPSLLRSIAVIARRGLTPTAIQIKSTRMPPWAPLPCKRSAQPTSTSSPEDKETYGALPMKWLCDFELALGQLLLIHLTGGGWTANCHNARIAYIYIYIHILYEGGFTLQMVFLFTKSLCMSMLINYKPYISSINA